ATLIAVEQEADSNIWIGSGESGTGAKEIKSDNLDGVDGLAWTADGRILYASRTSGKSDIWIMNPDGSNRRRLTDVGNNRWPSASTDGHYVVFMSDRSGLENIWRMDTDGSNPKELTSGGSDWYPDYSPANNSVVFLRDVGRRMLFRVSINGG